MKNTQTWIFFDAEIFILKTIPTQIHFKTNSFPTLVVLILAVSHLGSALQPTHSAPLHPSVRTPSSTYVHTVLTIAVLPTGLRVLPGSTLRTASCLPQVRRSFYKYRTTSAFSRQQTYTEKFWSKKWLLEQLWTNLSIFLGQIKLVHFCFRKCHTKMEENPNSDREIQKQSSIQPTKVEQKDSFFCVHNIACVNCLRTEQNGPMSTGETGYETHRNIQSNIPRRLPIQNVK